MLRRKFSPVDLIRFHTLTKKMQECLSMCLCHGHLYYHSGGFWSARGVKIIKSKIFKTFSYPEWYFSSNTVEALVKRKIFQITEIKTGKYGEYAVEVKPNIAIASGSEVMYQALTGENPCICNVPDNAFVATDSAPCTCEPDETTGNTEFETGILSCNICGGFVRIKESDNEDK